MLQQIIRLKLKLLQIIYAHLDARKRGAGRFVLLYKVMLDARLNRVGKNLFEIYGAAPVRVKHGADNAGKNLHYYLNYSSQSQTFTYSYAGGVDLLTRKPIQKSQVVTLGPWNLVIIEER